MLTPGRVLAQNTAGGAPAGTLWGRHAGRTLRQSPSMRYTARCRARVRDRRGVGSVCSWPSGRAQALACVQRPARRARAPRWDSQRRTAPLHGSAIARTNCAALAASSTSYPARCPSSSVPGRCSAAPRPNASPCPMHRGRAGAAGTVISPSDAIRRPSASWCGDPAHAITETRCGRPDRHRRLEVPPAQNLGLNPACGVAVWPSRCRSPSHPRSRSSRPSRAPASLRRRAPSSSGAASRASHGRRSRA